MSDIDTQLKYWFLINRELVPTYYDDHNITATAAFLETSECVWQLTYTDARSYNNMFTEQGQQLRFIHIEVNNPMTADGLKNQFVAYQEKKAAEEAVRKAAAQKAAETRKANKAKREAEKLAKDEDVEREVYAKLRDKYGDK